MKKDIFDLIHSLKCKLGVDKFYHILNELDATHVNDEEKQKIDEIISVCCSVHGLNKEYLRKRTKYNRDENKKIAWSIIFYLLNEHLNYTHKRILETRLYIWDKHEISKRINFVNSLNKSSPIDKKIIDNLREVERILKNKKII